MEIWAKCTTCGKYYSIITPAITTSTFCESCMKKVHRQETDETILKASTQSHSIPKILVVEDENDCLFVFESILNDEGYHVDAYGDPIEALSAFKPRYYDLILVDYRMGGIDGVKFIEKIRAVDISVKIIVVTAWEIQSLAKETQKYFVKVLIKPISKEKLLEEVRLALKPMIPFNE